MVPWGQIIEVIVESYGTNEWKGTLNVRLLGVGEEGAQLEHVRVLVPFANQSYGVYILPEIGELGYISFIDETNMEAVYIGSLFPLDSEHIEAMEEDNSHKIMQTKGGFQFDIVDKKDQETFSLTSKSGLKMHMDEAQQTLSISQKDGKQYILLDMKNNLIEILAGDTLSLESGTASFVLNQGKITIEAEEFNVNATSCVIKTKKETVLKSVNNTIDSTNKSILHGNMCEVSAVTKQIIDGGLIQVG